VLNAQQVFYIKDIDEDECLYQKCISILSKALIIEKADNEYIITEIGVSFLMEGGRVTEKDISLFFNL